jgi:hypothetical protein
MASNVSWLSVVARTFGAIWYMPFLLGLLVASLIILLRASVSASRQVAISRRRRVATSPYPARHAAPPGCGPSAVHDAPTAAAEGPPFASPGGAQSVATGQGFTGPFVS